MYDSQSIPDNADGDPLGPVATLPAVTFGARQAALAGVGRGMAGSNLDHLSAGMFTWHITCSSVTFVNGGSQGHDQTDS
jgi:hypothetical protein